jgi:uncharacterized protein
MTLQAKLQKDIKEAMKAQAKDRLSTLRMLLAAVKNEALEKGGDLDDNAFIAVVRRAVKMRRDSVEQYRTYNRIEAAEKEEAEIELLEVYLPTAPSDDEVRRAIAEVVAAEGLAGPKAMGAVMKVMKAKYGQNVDGATLNRLAKETLDA